MTIQRRLLALALAMALALGLAACSGGSTPESSPAASDSGEIDLTQGILSYAAGLSGNEVVLNANGTDVTADLFLYWMALNCASFEHYYGSYSALGYTVDAYADKILEDSVSMTAYYVLLEQLVQQYGCLLTDEQQAELEARLYDGGTDAYERRKTLYGLSDESMRFIYSVAFYYSNLLDTLIPTPTQEDLSNYVYQVKHILIRTVDDSKSPVLQEDGTFTYPYLEGKALEEKRALAERLLSQLQAADGLEATFDALMNEYSEDGRDDDGNLNAPDGYTAVPGQMAAPFEQAALSLAPGELSGIVETTYGYHILLRGEVENLDSYAEEYRAHQLDSQVMGHMEEANIARSDVIDSLDIPGVYGRYAAYQAALQAQAAGS